MTTAGGESRSVLAEQLDYYRARAPEYDRWFDRQGRYDRGPEANAAWFREAAQVRAALESLPLTGADVLELAPGTGIWTELLVERAARVTAVDGAPEMVAENKRRLGDRASKVTYILADLFEWAPEETWDVVVFCFWISHVPTSQLEDFLAGVARMVREGGTVFFLDGRRESSSTATDHVLPVDSETMVRRLDDGREFNIVKNYWTAAQLIEAGGKVGLDIEVTETDTYFQFGIARRNRPTAT